MTMKISRILNFSREGIEVRMSNQFLFCFLFFVLQRMIQRGVLSCPMKCKCDELTRCGEKYPQPWRTKCDNNIEGRRKSQLVIMMILIKWGRWWRDWLWCMLYLPLGFRVAWCSYCLLAFVPQICYRVTDHNSRNSMPYSLRIVCWSFNVVQSYEHWRPWLLVRPGCLNPRSPAR